MDAPRNGYPKRDHFQRSRSRNSCYPGPRWDDGSSRLDEQAGVPLSKSSAPVAFNSIFDQIAFIGGVLLAAFWVEEARQPTVILVGILVVLGLILWIPTSRRYLSLAAKRAAERLNLVEQWRQFIESVKDVLTPGIMAATMGITILTLALNIIILDLSLRGVGIGIPYASLFLAYVLPTMLGRLTALPGGVGITEAGMVGYLAATTHASPETIAAAVAIFRIVTILFQALVGALVYFFAWQGEKEMDFSRSSSHVREK
jgi:uncharacterized protein (TIRG00374 family)